MNSDQQITALAREYAEEIRKDILPFFPRPLPNSMEVLVQKDQKEAEKLIRFLLRRYCLVEKEAVRKEYEMVKKIWEQVTLVDAKTFSEGRISEIESLFPEIAKEVEE